MRTLPLTLLLACQASSPPADRSGAPSQSDSGTSGDDSGDGEGGDGGGHDEPAVEGCRADPGDRDKDRVVLVATPYTADATPSDAWMQLRLNQDGTLDDTGARHALGRAPWGRMAFTPDGSLGVVPLDDGTIGVAAVSADGAVSVVATGLDLGIYATSAAWHPSGERLWLLDGNWVENGGGLYEVTVDCATGMPGAPALVRGARMPVALLASSPTADQALLVARAMTGAPDGDQIYALNMDDGGALVASSPAFADDEASMSDAALTADGRYLLVADNSAFSGLPNRVAIATIDDHGAPQGAQILPDIYDPVALVASPHDDVVLVLSGYGDGLIVLARTEDPAAPFADAGAPTYTGSAPQLPTAAVSVSRGSLSGLTLITENQGVRTVLLAGDSVVVDNGVQVSGSGLEWISGAIGVQP